MSTAVDAPGSNFRLGMLIYDTRYRSLTIQVVFLALLIVMVREDTRHQRRSRRAGSGWSMAAANWG